MEKYFSSIFNWARYCYINTFLLIQWFKLPHNYSLKLTRIILSMFFVKKRFPLFQLYINYEIWVPATGSQCYKYDWKKIRQLRKTLTKFQGNFLNNLLECRTCNQKHTSTHPPPHPQTYTYTHTKLLNFTKNRKWF